MADSIMYRTTTTWMGMLSLGTCVAAYLFKKFPAEKPDHDAVMAAQLRNEREEQQRQGLA